MMDPIQAAAFLAGFSHSGAPVRDLSRIAGLMHRLGDPQDRLQFVHIAGTNGKGSVAEYLSHILIRSGYRTGTFTSPYIRVYEDRIRLDLENIPQDALCRHLTRIQEAVREGEGYSQFEITFAAAMLYFAEAGAHIVVLEVGMGGLLDCTNLIAPPLCAVITSVSLDHMAILGDTVEKIAAQKAGIIKPGSCAVLAADSAPGALRVLRETAEAAGVPYVVADPYAPPCRILEDGGIAGNVFQYGDVTYRTRMGGIHQIYNAVTAVCAVQSLRERGLTIPETAVQEGLYAAAVPARMQTLRTDPLVLLDGSHNIAGISALADVLEESGIRRWCGICGMTHADAVTASGERLSPLLDRVLCVDGFIVNAVPAPTLCEAFTCPAAPSDPEAALAEASAWAKAKGGAVVIFGSLYLASRYLQEE